MEGLYERLFCGIFDRGGPVLVHIYMVGKLQARSCYYKRDKDTSSRASSNTLNSSSSKNANGLKERSPLATRGLLVRFLMKSIRTEPLPQPEPSSFSLLWKAQGR